MSTPTPTPHDLYCAECAVDGVISADRKVGILVARFWRAAEAADAAGWDEPRLVKALEIYTEIFKRLDELEAREMEKISRIVK